MVPGLRHTTKSKPQGDTVNEDDSDSCTHCGNSLIYEDCLQCYGEGGRYLYEDNPIEYEPGEWTDCEVCEGTGVTTLCPNATCPGKQANTMATAMSGVVLSATTLQRPLIVDRQPDPGARARRKARKAQRQNRQHGRQQHAH